MTTACWCRSRRTGSRRRRWGARSAPGRTLTADALDPRAFEGVDEATLSWVGALAGAAVRTSQLIDALEHHEQVDAFQRGLIREAVARHEGNWAAAARSLGMHRSNLHHLAKRLGLR
ncbi:helix-turn-helix domain-containing protein [Sorangium sp. So ce429]